MDEGATMIAPGPPANTSARRHVCRRRRRMMKVTKTRTMSLLRVTAVALVAIAAAAIGVGVVVHASDPTALYARVDKGILEPNADKPQAIQVWGVFSMAKPDDRNDYLP